MKAPWDSRPLELGAAMSASPPDYGILPEQPNRTETQGQKWKG